MVGSTFQAQFYPMPIELPESLERIYRGLTLWASHLTGNMSLMRNISAGNEITKQGLKGIAVLCKPQIDAHLQKLQLRGQLNTPKRAVIFHELEDLADCCNLLLHTP